MDPSPNESKACCRYSSDSLERLACAALTAAGLPKSRAQEVAEVLLEGDLLGHTTHGLALLPAYLQSLKEGTMEKVGEPVVLSDRGGAQTWDGCYLPGPWLVRRAITSALAELPQHPVTTRVIRRSHHIACLQAYLKPVTDAGHFIVLTCSDPFSSLVTPHGGCAPRYCPNPIAAGIPTEGDPILIDISTSSTSNGMVQRALAAGEPLAGPWLTDTSGQATNDPRVLKEGGAILPLGGLDLGYKGFALGLLVEAWTNALAGKGRADQVSRWGASVFLQIIDPEAFGGREAFARETSHLAQLCRETPVPSGNPPVRLPGQAALRRRRDQLEHGVTLQPGILPALKPWLVELGIAAPEPILAE